MPDPRPAQIMGAAAALCVIGGAQLLVLLLRWIAS